MHVIGIHNLPEGKEKLAVALSSALGITVNELGLMLIPEEHLDIAVSLLVKVFRRKNFKGQS